MPSQRTGPADAPRRVPGGRGPFRRRVLAAALLLASGAALAAVLLPPRGAAPALPDAPGGFPEDSDLLLVLTSPGDMRFPRDVALGPEGDFYVVDRTATVRRFAPDGRAIAAFPMPERTRGNPQGLCVASDGRILVADTHCARIAVLSPSGEFLSSIGSPGKGPGEFIYPVSVAIGPGGRIWVGEYGGEDRIQVFGPDGAWKASFGSTGEEPGRFRRPSGLAFGPDGLLYVADACNHRIQAFDAEGTLRKVLGSFGAAPGSFHYPFDVAATPSGTLVVAEYGNNRVQEIDLDGRPLRSAGRTGSGEGELHCPWGIAAGPDGVVVSDTWNHRLQIWRRAWPVAPDSSTVDRKP
jgi:DNA-binding beta-propeller fold protein YncE